MRARFNDVAVKALRVDHAAVRNCEDESNSFRIPRIEFHSCLFQCRQTGGCGEDVTDPEIADAMLLLAQTEGIFAETAGGVTLAVTQKLIEQGKIPRDEEIVIAITGNGLKTQDAIADIVAKPIIIRPNIDDFAAVLEGEREPALV